MKKAAHFLFLSATALYWFAMYTYPVLLPNFSQAVLGASPAMAGAIVGSYGLVQMLLRVPLGFASDRLRRRKPFLSLGMALTMLAALGLWRVGTPGWALVFRGTAGGAAASWVAFSVLYASYGGQGHKDVRAMGTLSACMYGAQLLATQMGGWLARAQGERAAFLLAAVAGALGIVVSLFVQEKRPEGEPPGLRVLTQIARDRLLLISAGLSILQQLIVWATLYGFTPQWAKEVAGADASQLALLSTLHLLPNILCSWLCGVWLTPRYGVRAVGIAGFLAMALSCAAMPLTYGLGQMLALQALCGAGVGCVAPALLALCVRNIEPQRRGMAMGLYQSLYGIGMFAGPVLAGALVDAASPVREGVKQLTAGYRVNFIVIAGVGALAAALSSLLPRKEKG